MATASTSGRISSSSTTITFKTGGLDALKTLAGGNFPFDIVVSFQDIPREQITITAGIGDVGTATRGVYGTVAQDFPDNADVNLYSTRFVKTGALVPMSTVQLTTAPLPATAFPALAGDVTTVAGAFATAIGATKVTNAMLAGSIAASKLIGTDIITVGIITSGTWNGTAIDAATKISGILPIANGGTTGGWNTVKVSGSDFSTSSTSLVDITGLSFAAVASTNYEIDVWLDCSVSAVASGAQFGVNSTGTAPSVFVLVNGLGTSTTQISAGTNANNTPVATCLTVSSEEGFIHIQGIVKSGTGSPVISIRILKLVSGTVTVKIGSKLQWRVQ